MGLSKSSRVRNSARQVQPDSIAPSLAYVLRFQVAKKRSTCVATDAVRLRSWLQSMQKQFQNTATALRDNPSQTLSAFQKILSRPSYFLAPQGATPWVVLLGPRTARPEARGPRLHTYDFVAPQPALFAWVGETF